MTRNGKVLERREALKKWLRKVLERKKYFETRWTFADAKYHAEEMLQATPADDKKKEVMGRHVMSKAILGSRER